MECKTTSSIFSIQKIKTSIYNVFKNGAYAILLLMLSLFFVQSIYAANSPLNEINLSSSFIDKEVFQPKMLNESVLEFSDNVYHFFTHGRSGELLINGKWLNAKEIANFLNSEFNIQHSSFSYLNIYGCEFAKGEKGLKAVSYLENVLGLKVNASTNITGKDGDWVLEVGNTNTNSFKSYQYNLQIVNSGSTEDYDGDSIANQDDLDDDNDGILDVIECDNIIPFDFGENPPLNGSKTFTIPGTDIEVTMEGNSLPSLVSDDSGNFSFSGSNKTLNLTFSVPISVVVSASDNSGGPHFGAGNSTHAERFAYTIDDGGSFTTIQATSTNQVYYSSGLDASGNFDDIGITPYNSESSIIVRGNTNPIGWSATSTLTNTLNIFFDNGNTAGDMKLKLIVPCTLDLDNDGIVNSLDLDSDGDGCPDAVEGGGAYTSTDLVNSTTAGGGSTAVTQNFDFSLVDANGVPNTDGNVNVENSQTVGNSQTYGENTECCSDPVSYPGVTDTDGDNLGDGCDADDDNDGIKDIDERCPLNFSVSDPGTQNLTWNSWDLPNLTSSSDSFYASPVHRNNNGTNPTVTGDFPIHSGVPNETNSAFGETGFNVNNDKKGNFATLEGYFLLPGGADKIELRVHRNNSSSNEVYASLHIAVFNEELTTDASKMIKVSEVKTNFIGNGTLSETIYEVPDGNDAKWTRFGMAISDGRQAYGVSLEWNVNDTGWEIIPLQNVSSLSQSAPDNVNYCDTDNDGIINRLDLDSDGDGCPDAVEGGGNYTATDLVNSTTVAGGSTNVTQNFTSSTVDANGVPNTDGNVSVENSQTVDVSQSYSTDTECCRDPDNYPAISDTDGDNLGDGCDVDDDNDGIIDIDEKLCIPVITTSNPHFSSLEYFKDGISLPQLNSRPYSTAIDGDTGGNAQTNTEYSIIDTAVFTFKGAFTGANVTMSLYNDAGVVNNYEGWRSISGYDVFDVDGNIIAAGGAFNFGPRGVTGDVYSFLLGDLVNADKIVFYDIVNRREHHHSIRELLISQGTFTDKCRDSDTDNDGISDLWDLDSDGDGCPDAIEGAGNYTKTDLQPAPTINGGNSGANYGGVDEQVQQNLGSLSNLDGSPNLDNNTVTNDVQQTAGDSRNFGVDTECCTDAANYAYVVDTDNDGIGDKCDVDDDNDGISDDEEVSDCAVPNWMSLTPSNGALVADFFTTTGVRGTVTSVPGDGDFNTSSPAYSTSTSNISVNLEGGSTNTIFTVAYTNTVSVRSSYRILDISSTEKQVVIGYDENNNKVYPVVIVSSNVTISGESNNVFVGTTNTGSVSFKFNIPIKKWVSTTTGTSDDVVYQIVSACKILDTDNDSIINSLDLDSDGDGCPDAIEGDGGISYTSGNLVVDSTMDGGGTNVQQNFGTSSNSDGTPNLSGTDTDSESQSIGDSKNYSSTTECCNSAADFSSVIDTDNDGIGDNCDEDDDNDGILDADDGACRANLDINWNDSGTYGADFILTNLHNTGVDVFFSTAFNNGASPISYNGIGSAEGYVAAINWEDLPAVDPDEVVVYTFDFSEEVVLENFSLKDIDRLDVNDTQGFIDAVKVYGVDVNGNKIPLNTTVSSIITQDVNGFYHSAIQLDSLDGDPNHWVTVNSNGVFLKKIVVEASASIGSPVGLTPDFGSKIIFGDLDLCMPVDTDNDGFINSLDLDSDGDGCPDALEGDGPFTELQLEDATTINGGNNNDGSAIGYTGIVTDAVIQNLGNDVDDTIGSSTYGVPTIAGAGQGAGASIYKTTSTCDDVDGDGIGDYDDLDDDNDGILDTVESSCTVPTWDNSSPATTSISEQFTATNGIVGTLTSIADNNTFSAAANYIQVDLNQTNTVATVTFNPFPSDEGSRYEILNLSTTEEQTVVGYDINGDVVYPIEVSSSNINISGTNSNVFVGTSTDGAITFYFNRPILSFVTTSTGAEGGISLRVLSLCKVTDTDNDGIVDSLDLDSDGDGCPDAIEGAGNISTNQLFGSSLSGGNTGTGFTGITVVYPVRENLGNTVDINGVPTVINGGQGVGSAKDKTISNCTDTDGDGVNDYWDLDDDNDGILDIDEGDCGLYPDLIWNSTETYGTNFNLTDLNGTEVDVDFSSVFSTNSTSGASHGSFTDPDGYIVNVEWKANEIATFTFEFTEGVAIEDFAIKGIDRDNGSNSVDAVKVYGIDVDNNTIPLYIISGSSLTQDANGFYYSTLDYAAQDYDSNHWISASSNTILLTKIIVETTTTADVTPTNAVPFNSRILFGELYMCMPLDIDNDGIPNYLDLDSDGDGCPDAIEGGSEFLYSQLEDSTTIDGGNNNDGSAPGYTGLVTDSVIRNLGNTVGTTIGSETYGVPTIAGTGQSIGLSEEKNNSTCADYDRDGVADSIDLDNDNDGILDSVEGNGDADNDGIPNYLDLDSDGDGCPDAIEGGGNILESELVDSLILGGNTGTGFTGNPGVYPVIENLGITVDANGVPIIVNGGQPTGFSMDKAKSACTDTDGDGVNDYNDLDDDNDGILDTEEGTCGTGKGVVWDSSGNYGANFTLPSLSNTGIGVDFTSAFNSGSSANSDASSLHGTFDNPDGLIIGIDWENLLADDPNETAIFTFDFTEEVGLENFSIKNIDRNTGFIDAVKIYGEDINGSIVPLTITPGSALTQDANGYYHSNTDFSASDDDQNHWLTASSDGVLLKKVIIESSASVGNPSGTAPTFPSRFILGNLELCMRFDSDNDGITNSLDLDSDGDGCPDALEGGDAILESQLLDSSLSGGNTGTNFIGNPGAFPVIENLGNDIDSDGVPIIVSGSQNIGNSQNKAISNCNDIDGDGVNDYNDLDNDNDGILDADEDDCGSENLIGGSISESTNYTRKNGSATGLTYDSSPANQDGSITYSDIMHVSSTSTGFDLIFFADGEIAGNTLGNINVINHLEEQSSSTGKFVGESYYEFSNIGADNAWEFDIKIYKTIIASNGGDLITNPNDLLITSESGGTVEFISSNATTGLRYKISGGVTSFTIKSSTHALLGEIKLDMISNLNSNETVSFRAIRDFYCDTDSDSIPNHLDLDSDGDGCPDAVEGGGNYAYADLVSDTNFAGGGTNVQQNLGIASNFDGTPDLDNNTASSDSQQTVGDSQNYGVDTECCQDATHYTYVIDSDSDTIGDSCDLDDDNDGILDTDEYLVNDPFGDEDGDELYNYLDTTDGGTGTDGSITDYTDANLDGVPDVYDADKDGIVNHLDLDSDGDSCPDSVEGGGDYAYGDLVLDTNFAGGGTNIQQNLGSASNFDGTPDLDNNTASSDSQQTVGDSQNYGVDTECCQDATHYSYVIDSDSDTIGDSCDLDDDNDGILDADEYLVNDPFGDEDGDELYNYLDVSDDGTGTDGSITDYTDANLDGVPDVYDADKDGIVNHLDLDSDGDSCPDAIEGAKDYDNDDLETDTNLAGGSTSVQKNLGSTSNIDGTPDLDNNPATSDSQQAVGDSQNYGVDTECCKDVANFPYVKDTDGDKIGDSCDLDDDNDGILDTDEYLINNPFGDEDGDETYNYLDVSDDGTGTDGSTTDYTDANLDGVPDVYDTDYDGVVNHLDTDSDNDDCSDAIEGAGNYTIDEITHTLSDGSIGGSTSNFPLPVNDNGIPVPPGATGEGTTGQGYSAGAYVVVQVNQATTPEGVTQEIAIGTSFSYVANATADANTAYDAGNSYEPVFGVPGNANNGLVYSWAYNDGSITGTDVLLSETSNTLNLGVVDESDAGIYTLKITHINNACFEQKIVNTLVIPECDISASGLTGQTCNDAGTNTDPSDDYITFSLNPTANVSAGTTYTVSSNNGSSVTLLGGGTAQGTFGSSTEFRLQNGSADDSTVYTLTITSDADGGCKTTQILSVQDSCSDTCAITGAGLVSQRCNDNSTNSNALDDYITFDLNPTSANAGTTYTVTSDNGGLVNLVNGGAAQGTFGSVTSFKMQAGSSDGATEYTLTITSDADGSCSTTQALAIQDSCSDTCEISAVGLTSQTCNDNGTESDASDDYITFSLNPTSANAGTTYTVSSNNGSSVTLLGGGTAQGTFGSATEFRLQNGSTDDSTVYTLTITSDADGGCKTTQTLSIQESCSDTCAITGAGLVSQRCNDNGTDSNASDDYITFDLNPTSANAGTTYTVTSDNGGVVTLVSGGATQGTFGSATSFRLQAGSSDGTTEYTLTITSDADGSCSTTQALAIQDSCSDTCEISAVGLTSQTCNDNGTESDASDDYITFSLNPTSANAGTTYTVSSNNGSSVTLLGGGTAQGTFGSATEFRLQNGSADDSTVYTLTITSDADGGCKTTQTLSVQDSCSDTCAITGAGLASQTCNDNGTESDSSDDYITFSLNPTSANAGTTYTVSSNNGSSVTLLGGGTAQGTFGSATSFKMQAGSSDGVTEYTLTITSDADGTCSTTQALAIQESCSDTCEILAVGLTSQTCNDNGTESDASDDYITFSLNSTGFNTGTTYIVLANNGGVVTLAGGGIPEGTFGVDTAFRMQAGSSDGATQYILTITSEDDSSCSKTQILSVQESCSNTCAITGAGLASQRCNDNGTNSNASDDYITFDLNPTSANAGTTYTVTSDNGGVVTLVSGGATQGTFGSATSFRLQAGSSDGTTEYTLTITSDADGSCSTTQALAIQDSCSDTCEISAVGLTSQTCNDNGTESDASDDYITFSLNPTSANAGTTYTVSSNNGSSVTLLGGGTAQGTFGSATEFRLQNGSADDSTVYTLTITSDADGGCKTTQTLSIQESCSDTCAITGAGLVSQRCNDNGTNSNASDDYITFDLNPTSANAGTTYTVTSDNGGVVTLVNGGAAQGTFGSATSFRMQAGSSDGATEYTLTITSDADGTCSTTQALAIQESCSDTCEILAVGLTSQTCNDNGTESDASDDYITFSLNPTSANAGITYTVSSNNGSSVTLLGGGTAQGTFGSATEFRLQNGSADDSTVYTLTITSDADGGCKTTQTLSVQDSCSDTCAITGAGLASQTCNDNGTESDSSDDYITFSLNPTSANAGTTYTVSSNNGSSVTLLGGGTAQGTFGSATSFKMQAGSSDGVTEYTLTITSDADGTCSTTQALAIQESCSDTCEILAVGLTSQTCNDNGTESDASDDYITFSLNSTGFNTGTTYIVLANNGGVVTLAGGGIPEGTFGVDTAFRMQAGSSDGATQYILTITSEDDSSCSKTQILSVQESCSNTCAITGAGLASQRCNDNGTNSNASDDYITFDLNPTSANAGTTYTVTSDNGGVVTLISGGDAQGTFGSATSFRMQAGSSDGATEYTLTITSDADGTCNITQVLAIQESCSDTCEILAVGLTSQTCNDNGTESDSSDDYITFSLNPTSANAGTTYTVSSNNGSSVTLLGGGTAQGTFGSATSFRLQAGSSDGVTEYTLTITSDTDGTCSTTQALTIQESCSDTCDISAVDLTSQTCNDNGTESDSSDDYITFSLNPTSANAGTTYTVSSNNGSSVTLLGGGTAQGTFGSATEFRLQNGSADDSTVYTLTITSEADGACSKTQILEIQESCSVICAITGSGLASQTCNDNGTESDASDDYITFDLNPTSANAGTTYTVTSDNGGVVNLVNGGAAQGTFGSVTSFRLQAGSSDGTTEYTLTITSDADGSCSTTQALAIQDSCSDTCEISAVGLTSQTCNDNGTESDASDDYITFSLNPTSANAGTSYTVSSNNGSSVTLLGGGTAQGTFGLSTEFRLQNGSADDSTVYILTITSEDDSSCSKTQILSVQDSCSDTCAITGAGLALQRCNDNGTVSNASDDYITFDLNPTSANAGTTYTVTSDNGGLVTLVNGGAAQGIFGSATSFKMQAGSSDGTTEYTLTITSDADGSCSTTQALAIQDSCSDTCEISAVGLTSQTCNDNGTESDASDDYITFSLNPTSANAGTTYTVSSNNGSSVTLLGGGTAQGTFGSSTEFRLQNGSADDSTVYTLTITSEADGACSKTQILEIQESCSVTCAITGAGLVSQTCNDNGTDSNASDDYITFDLNPTSANAGTTYTVTSDNGGVVTLVNGGAAQGTFGSVTSFKMQAGSSDGVTEYTLTITSDTDGTCSTTQALAIQESCSDTCEILAVGLTSQTCNDNGTESDATDDYITFDLNPTGFNTGTKYSVLANNGGVVTLEGGGIPEGTFGVDTAFRMQAGSSDGATQYILTITSEDDSSCSKTQILSVQDTCSDTCVITGAGLASQTCNDNGTDSNASDDYITFDLNPTSANAGTTYTVTSDNGGVVTLVSGGATQGTFGSATSFRLQAGSSDGTTEYTLTITSDADGSCSTTQALAIQDSCSDTCEISAVGLTSQTCNDNGTESDASDDYITFSLNPTSANAGTTYTVSSNNGSSVTLLGGGTAQGTFGSSTEFRLQAGSSDGVTEYTLTITSDSDDVCSITQVLAVQVGCSYGINPIDDAVTVTAAIGESGITITDSVLNVLANDEINGIVVDIDNVEVTVVTYGPLTVNADGSITIAEGTGSGVYTVDYEVCELGIVPVNCNSATLTVTVGPTDVIDAVDNDYSGTPIDTSENAVVVGDITTNDLLNGVAVTDTDISITVANEGGISGVTIDSNGNLTVPAETPAGSYTVSYTICEVAVPTNCDTANVEIFVGACLNFSAKDCDGDGVTNGQEITDGTDPADLCDFLTASQTMTTSSAWNAADCDGDGVTNGHEVTDGTDSNNPCDGIGGTVDISNTVWQSGDCDRDGETNGEELINGTDPNDPCSNNGTGTIDTSYEVWQLADCDGDGVTNLQESIDGTDSNDPCDLDVENQTLTPSDIWYTLECEGVNSITGEIGIEIHNVITPDGDGNNDVLIIAGLKNHPSNTVKIYNRWGVLVYDIVGYNNEERAFRGYSDGRTIVDKSESLPVGTYFYVLTYKDSISGKDVATSGYLYIQR